MLRNKQAFIAITLSLAISGLILTKWHGLTAKPASKITTAPTKGHTAQPLPASEQTNVIFDLNGVLFAINRKKALTSLGFFDMLSYSLAHGSHELEETMFNILYKLDAKPVQGDALIPLHNGKPLPTIMCQWMRGKVTSQEVIERLEKHIETLDQEKFFKDDREKRLIIKMINVFFDAEVRSELYAPIKKSVALLKECKALGHNVYLLSNIDTELIQLLQDKHPDIFELFDGMVLSADVGMIKPDTNIFNYTLKQFRINPANCYLVDDQAENIEGAQRMGITGILYDKKEHKKAYNSLVECGVVHGKERKKAAVKTA